MGGIMERNISVIKDVNGNKIVVINDICFKGRQNIDWNEVEQYLKRFLMTTEKFCVIMFIMWSL